MRRQADQLPNAFNAVSGDYTKAADLMGLAELCPDYLLFTPTPTSRDESGYWQGFDQPARALSAGDMSRALRGAVMISSTRVFAEKSGGRVDEFSAIAKDDPCAEAIFSAEQQFMSGIPAATIFRASGLYNGSPTGHLVSRVSSGIFSADRNRYSNRIHREDLARAIEFALLSAEKGKPLIGCYVASDDRPSLVGEVEAGSPSDSAFPTTRLLKAMVIPLVATGVVKMGASNKLGLFFVIPIIARVMNS